MTSDSAARARDPLLLFADQLSRQNLVPSAAGPTVLLQVVTFILEREEFGIPIQRVREVIGVGEITRVPQAPPHVRGVTNLRGRVLAVLDLRTRLGLAAAPVTPRSRIVVIEIDERVLGVLVDAVNQVVKIPGDAVVAAPPEVLSPTTNFIAGVVRWNSRLIVLLDLEKAVMSRD